MHEKITQKCGNIEFEGTDWERIERKEIFRKISHETIQNFRLLKCHFDEIHRMEMSFDIEENEHKK